MVGILLIFCLNNLLWAIVLVCSISLVRRDTLPKFSGIKPNRDPVDPGPERYDEATDEQIIESFNNLRDTMVAQTGFDENGNQVEATKEEGVVE